MLGCDQAANDPPQRFAGRSRENLERLRKHLVGILGQAHRAAPASFVQAFHIKRLPVLTQDFLEFEQAQSTWQPFEDYVAASIED